MDGNVSSNICLPKVNSVEDGRVCRIESYGAFVQLQDIRYSHRGRPLMGLVHISELREGRVNSVEDICSLDMNVKVRVLEVTEDDGGRYRIKLSMKGLNGDESVSRRTAASVAVLGMGSAGSALVDPLVAMRQSVSSTKSNLVLKNRDGNSEEMLFNGYALVDDTAGEPDHEALALLNDRNGSKLNGDRRSSSLATTEPSTIGRGRGRGRTLPAWMTSGSSSNNVDDNLPSRAVCGDNTPHDDGSSTNSSLSTRSKKRKRRKRHESKSHRKRSKKGSSSRSSRHRHKKEKSAKRRHRTRSRSRYDADSSSGSDREYYRTSGSTKEVDRKFSSVDEAKDLIRRLESGGS